MILRQIRLSVAAVVVAFSTYIACWTITVYVMSDRLLPSHPVAALVPATFVVACGGLVARARRTPVHFIVGMVAGYALFATLYVCALVILWNGFAAVS